MLVPPFQAALNICLKINYYCYAANWRLESKRRRENNKTKRPLHRFISVKQSSIFQYVRYDNFTASLLDSLSSADIL